MAKDHDFEAAGEDPLTTRDLVLLYKNIDLGKQLMSNVKGLKQSSPNQHVETVVHQGARGSDTDLSECPSAEDLDSVVMVNKERIDLFSNQPSNTLCHKFSDIEIQTSGFTSEYDRHFLFKDPYIKEQLKSLKLMSASSDLDSAVLPASLLDYICCKRLEDNYNFYMDNIIRYVKNTIEQLKRISNGDYLTEKAKEKWKEVENDKEGGDNASKVLTTSTSIPLHVERKVTGLLTTWDDLVHSEVDLRSLAKILEKRIVVEVPKLISGSYKLFSKRRAENLVISCKRKEPGEAALAPQARVDVVFQLQRSETGQVISNIDSIMILESDLPTIEGGTEKLSLMYEEEEPVSEKPKIIELNDHEDVNEICCPFPESDDADETDSRGYGTNDTEDALCEVELASKGDQHVSFSDRQPRPRSPQARASRLLRAEATNNLATPEDMRFTLQTLDTPLVEESIDGSFSVKTKKKSPSRVRVKSPYENKSHVLEEKKRKKLLEVRERRERKKMAMGDKKKLAINPKYYKSAISPQASSSVTKLSITNKSFYNSIFGQNFNMENAKQLPIPALNKGRLGQKKDGAIPEIVIEQPEEEGQVREEGEEAPRALKYIDRSYYLDDAVTEMMYLQMKQNGAVTTSASTSAVSNDSGANLPHFTSPSLSNIVVQDVPTDSLRSELLGNDLVGEPLITSQSALSVVPVNTVKGTSPSRTEPLDKSAAFIECRRSIDKIYMLMNKGGKIDPSRSMSRQKSRACLAAAPAARSDSGTSVKLQPASSPSSFSFEQPPDGRPGRQGEPKVIISAKQRAKHDTSTKPDVEKPKKKVTLSPRVKTFADNPLKAISQLLHEFDYVQKTRQKSVAETKPGNKKEAGPAEERSARLEAARRRLRVEVGRDRPPTERPAPAVALGPRARPRAELAPEARGRAVVRKISEIIDEVKEARGEAVRGPAFSARLQALAQPRRSYVQARGEELPRHARAQALERAQRPSERAATLGAAMLGARPRSRRAEPGALLPDSPPATSLLERAAKARRPASCTPDARLAEARHPDVRFADPRAPVAETLPQNLKKKMVAVESYVKVHYGRGVGAGHSARALPLSTDFELASMTSSLTPEESSAIGSKLHRMVDNVLARSVSPARRSSAPAPRAAPPAPRPPPAPGAARPPPRASPPAPRAAPPAPAPSLHALAVPTRPSHLSPLITLSQTRRELSKDSSDYTDDIISDKQIVTAVATLSHGHKQQTQITKPTQLTNQTQQTQLIQQTQQTQHSPGTYNSIAELEMLENALYRKMSQGAFPKRLRIKNLTLTPKHSTQRIMVLQSGDSTSLVLKSKLSKIKINASKSTSNEMGYQTLSTTHVDWRFSQMPLQISTVGYALPSYENDSGSNMITQKNTDTEALMTEKAYESDSEYGSPKERDKVEITCQYFKGSRAQADSECAVQANTDFGAPTARLQAGAMTSTTANAGDHLSETAITTQIVDQDVIATEQSETEISNPVDKEGTAFIDYTSSLDMLVGLLNEIQKITSCSGVELGDSKDDNQLRLSAADETSPARTAPSETTPARKLDKIAPVETLDMTSVTSVNMRRTELDINTYGTTLYTTLDQTALASELKEAAPANNPDEAATADAPYTTTQVGSPDEAAQDNRNNQLSKEDSVPLHDPVSNSNLITLYKPKNVVSSDVLFKTEMKSVVAKCVDMEVSPPPALPAPSSSRAVLCSRPGIETSKIRLREIGTNPGTVKSLVLFHDNVVKDVKNVSVTCKNLVKKAKYRKDKPSGDSNNFVDTVDPGEGGQAKSLNKCLNAAVSDPMVRVKRDILVTVYSLLVLTVFAALSLPEMLLHQA